MLPVIALVGRPNVGKSTLFNRLTRSRDALVADIPGLTRDRQYGTATLDERPYVVMDTGGLSGDNTEIDEMIARQVGRALEEADAILLLVDARAGLTATDEAVATHLRRIGKPLYLVANKAEHLDIGNATAEFYRLGVDQVYAISAAHNHGVQTLMEVVLGAIPDHQEDLPAQPDSIRLAIIGRPNVGKSTLVNRLLGEERVLASDMPGTTRDAVAIPFEHHGQHYTLIDTAGIRRRGRVHETIEKFSVLKSLQAMEQAHAVVLVLDARQGISEQDVTLLGHVLSCGRALVVTVNKWDRLPQEERTSIRRELDRRLNFLDFARLHFISALHGSGVMDLLKSVDEAHTAATRHFPTSELTRILNDAVTRHQPPMVGGRNIKLRYAHQGGHNPPLIIIHGNRTDRVPDSYRRYLANTYRQVLDLWGTPLRIEFRSGENPYAPGGHKRTNRR